MKKRFGKIAAIMLSFCMALGMLTGCGSDNSTASGTEDYSDIVVSYGLTSSWKSLNPYSTNAGGLYAGLVQDKIYDKLFYINAGGKTISPRNAESWEFDGKTLTINLNKKAVWHDGQAVTAKDWVYTCQLLTNPDVAYVSRSNMNIFEGTDEKGVASSPEMLGVTAKDDYTLVMTFKKQYDKDGLTDIVVSNFKQLMVLPEHILSGLPAGKVLDSDYFLKPIGSGPCVYESEIVDSQITMTSFANYYLGAPKFGKLVMTVVSASNVVTSVLADELDYAFPFLSVDNFLAAKDEGMEIDVSEDANKLNMLILNTSTIADSRIRLAMQYAIDKKAMVSSVMMNYGVVADSYMLPTSEYLNKNLSSGQNLEKAKELLAEAGYTGKAFTLAIPSGYRVQLANMIKQDCAKAGITINIETVDSPTMFAGIQDGSYDMIIMADTMTASALTAEWYYDATAANYSSLTDTNFNEKMDAIKNCTDDVQYKSLVNDFQSYCFEQSPMIPLFYQYNFALSSKRLTNFVPFDSQMFNDAVWNWKITK